MKPVINVSTLTTLTADQARDIAQNHPLRREYCLRVKIETSYGQTWIRSSGNNRERAALADAIRAADRRASEPARIAAGPALATQRQRDYLVDLIREDYGTAKKFGVADGLPAGLSRREASRLIDEFLSVSRTARNRATA